MNQSQSQLQSQFSWVSGPPFRHLTYGLHCLPACLPAFISVSTFNSLLSLRAPVVFTWQPSTTPPLSSTARSVCARSVHCHYRCKFGPPLRCSTAADFVLTINGSSYSTSPSTRPTFCRRAFARSRLKSLILRATLTATPRRTRSATASPRLRLCFVARSASRATRPLSRPWSTLAL